MEEDWKVKESSKRNEMLKDKKFLSLITKLVIIVPVGAVAFYITMQIFSIRSSQTNEILNGSNPRQLLLSAKYFFSTQSSPTYEIICFGQTAAGTIMSMIYGCYEGLFIILVFHLCSQLNILQQDVRTLVSRSDDKIFSTVLKPIVDRHFQLKKYFFEIYIITVYVHNKSYNIKFRIKNFLRFSDEIEKIFNVAFLEQIISISICLCLLGYQLIAVSINKFFPFIYYKIKFKMLIF